MKKRIISTILKRVQDGSIPKDAGVDLCFEVGRLEDGPSVSADLEEVAVIGLAGRYPQARNVDELWEILKAGRDVVTEIPPERWDWKAYAGAEPNPAGQGGKSYGQWGGFIEGYDEFDPFFFNLSPREAGYMDLQERLFLEVAWETLEDAGYTRDYFAIKHLGSASLRVGVFVGATWQEGQLFSDARPEKAEAAFSTHAYNIANRVSYFCGFQGPSISVDTACSSSLTALHMAWESIARGTADMALAGGVNLSIHPNKFRVLAAAGFASQTGRCQSFGSGADGYVPAEGVGALLLKPKAKAIADGDHIYGVIKASAINHGGKTNGYTVPSPAAQASVVGAALRLAKVDPRTVSYLEAHGTGTALGDPIEIAGLEQAFGTQAKQYCAIGSIKSNLGHCEAAAGIAGITKVLLQMCHGQLVPSLHADVLNPRIAFERSPFRVQRQFQEWKRPVIEVGGQSREQARIAGVSSFGAGGANAHVILEEFAQKPGRETRFNASLPFAIVLSARNSERLEAVIKRLADYLSTTTERSPAHLATVAYTLQVGRDALEERLAFLASSLDEACDKLQRARAGSSAAEGIFRGKASRGNPDLTKLGAANHPEMPVRADDLEAWLKSWVQGGPVNWEALHAGESLRRVRLPTYPFARERYPLEIPDLGKPSPAAKAVSPATDEPADPHWDGMSYLPEWVEKPAPQMGERLEEKRGRFLVVCTPGAKPLADALEQYCRQRHPQARLTRLEIGSEVGKVDLESLRQRVENPDQIDGVFFLVAGNCCPGSPDTIPTDKFCEAEMFLLRLARLCGQQSPLDLYVVRAEAMRTAAGAFPLGGGLAGLACAIAQSNHHFRVRNIRLTIDDWADLEGVNKSVALMVEEPPSDRGSLVRISGGIRCEQEFSRWDWSSFNAQTGLRPGGVYVIIGGSGTVGGVLTRHLLRNYQAKVFWIGRRDPDSPEIRQRLAAQETTSGKLRYLQADATQRGALEQALATVKEQWPVIHGVIFAAVEAFGGDDSVATVPEAAFQRCVEVKTAGLWQAIEASRAEPLDFFCVFSSIQAFSFLSARGSANYAAAITGGDAVAEAMAPQTRFPIGCIHWSYWRASVAGTPLEQSLKEHFETLQDQEACEFFDKYTALLRSQTTLPLICMRAAASVRRLMPGSDVSIRTLAAATAPSLITAVAQDFRAPVLAVASAVNANDWGVLEEWLATLMLAQVRRMGVFPQVGEQRSALVWASRAGLAGKYQKWWETCCLPALEARSWIQRTGDGLALAEPGLTDPNEVWTQWESRKSAWENQPDMQAGMALAETCLRRLPEILRGEILATDILFPGSSMQSVGEMYRGNSVADLCNATLAEFLDSYLEARVRREPQVKLRIIEIGAGTGATTAEILPRLKRFQDHVEHYVYTDISKAFLLHAEDHFQTGYGFLTTAKCNIEQAPAEQGFELGTYDVLIASNVLHATANIQRTLRHAKSLLKRHGLLALNEATQKTLLGCLTFGLLDGWWLFEDAAWRIPGAPLLDLSRWRRALDQAGFSKVFAPLEKAETNGQHILLAESDGLVGTTANPTIAMNSIPIPNAAASGAENKGAGDLAPRVTEAVLRNMASTLRTSEDKIDPEIPFSDYGLDSILGSGFIDSLNRELGIRLNAAVIFDHTSVHRLTQYIIKTCHEELANSFPQAGVAAIGTSREVASAPIASVTTGLSPASVTIPGPSRIAVIGLSGQFPGAATASQFWDNLMSGRDGVGELPPAYLQGANSGQPLYSWGGVLADRDCFDSLFFNISPREAAAMHPHQRLVLQECWKALEDAGLNPKNLEGSRAGVYVGAESTGHVMPSFTGSSEALIASRISYFLNLKGPALLVNTGCSSSAAAIHLACESLRHGESDLALACGVYAGMNQPGLGVLAEIGMLSPRGQCRTFDAEADGTVLSEGVGVVVLKRLEAALADGDPIYGVIVASGMNQDGASNGITAPNGASQEALISEVYRRFKIDPEQIGYLEAHGTGTRLGDPVEANALQRAFAEFTRKTRYCVVGSAKSHIGHTSAAAGVIGLIRILLSMRARHIPAMLHFQTLNPLIEWEKSPFYINQESMEWQSPDGRPRMAAMNAFGHSGTNVHLVVEEHLAARADKVASRPPYLIVLSAKDSERLADAAQQLLSFHSQHPDAELRDVGYTLQIGREAMNERLGLLVESWADLESKLRAFLASEPRVENSYRGSVRTQREALAPFFRDEDAGQMVAAWFNKGKYGKLLEVWVKGFPVEWKSLYPGEIPRRIHYPPYPFAKDSYPAPLFPGAKDSHVASVSIPAQMTNEGEKRIVGPTPNSQVGWDGFSYMPSWVQAPAPAATFNAPRTVLLAYSPSFCGLERSLAEYYRHQFPSATIIEYDLSKTAQELSAIAAQLPTVDVFYFLAMPETIMADYSGADLDRDLEQHERALLRLLKRLLGQAAKDSQVACYVLTVDNYRVGSHDTLPSGGGVTGLAYALAQADHRFRVRNLDLSREDLQPVASHAALLEHIHAEPPTDRGEVVKLRGGGRWVRTFRRWDWASWRTGSGIRQGGVYVILGGSGVVGGIITRGLMARHGARVVWLGRRPVDAPEIQSQLRACSHAGKTPDYYQADATQEASLRQAIVRIRETHGQIHGAIFAGLIFDPQGGIATTTEEAFGQILELKAQGGFNFYEAFRDAGLDFLCYFSSIQAFSFLSARESCGYAAGITFGDTLAACLNGNSRFPVGVINWGYWERSVAGTALENRLREHFEFISDAAGVEFFERFTHLLRHRVLSQMACFGASERVQKLMGDRAPEMVTAHSETAGFVPEEVFTDDPHFLDETENLIKHNPLPALEPWLLQLLEAQLWRMRAFTGDGQLKPSAEMQAAGLLAAGHVQWWEECRRLVENGSGRRAANLNPDEVWEKWERAKADFLNDTNLRGATELVDACLRQLPAVLKGEVPATDVLFPKSSLLEVGKLHGGNAVADHLNGIVAGHLARYLRHRAQSDPEAPIRLLEVGAGTGATAAVVLPALAGIGPGIAEYNYTDISKAFLVHGEKQFAGQFPCLKFSLWNVEAHAEAGWLGHYDVVIATNVLHATRDIRQTLRHVKTVLKRQGLLILNEGIEKTVLGTLTFGLLDGWWRFEDPNLRIPGTPLLTPEMWESALLEAGFSKVVFPESGIHKLGHQVIIAESDGICQLPGASGGEHAASARPAVASAKPLVSGTGSKFDARANVVDAISQALAEALNLPAAKIDRECSFADYGVDSILGVSFIEAVNARLGVSLGTAIIFDYSTVTELAGHVLRAYPKVIAAIESPAVAPAIQPPASSFREPEAGPVFAPPANQPVATPNPVPVAGNSLSPIAVVGMSGQFPGAENVERFWENLMAGVDGIAVLPDRYAQEELFRLSEGKASYRWGGMLAGRDHFDPLFFRISPREAESMSPHQRLVLQEGWKSLEVAGYNPRSLHHQRVGVFIGAEPAGYFHESFTGSSDAIVASRLSYHLNFRGPALVVNTGCSSSAVAIHLACESLRRHESDMALAGGVCATVGPSGLNVLADAGMLSPTGQCHSLDASADGTVLSEGVGMVVLKRLEDALAAGDTIHGVIQASGINQDGASNGITAPNGIAQEALIVDVCRRFGIDPEHIDYVETHGTGTRLGDPVEVNALVRAYRQFTAKTQYCALGSAKSHIGHTSAASGVIGLIKVLMSLKHRRIPALLHFKAINPLCEIAGSAFYVNQAPLELGGIKDRPLMAALNSFGHSGTNAHLVVSEYLEDSAARQPVAGRGPRLVILSAKNREQMQTLVANLGAFLERHREVALVDLAYTLQLGRDAMSERAAWLVDDVAGLITKLRAFDSGAGSGAGFWRGQVDEESPAVRLLASDSDTRDLMAKWLAAGKLEKLAELWAQGVDIDWQLLYGGVKPRRISLPTYPFARNSFWIPAATVKANLAVTGAAYLHPLVQENRSGFSKQRYVSRFNGEEFFFRDHRVRGVKVLPGVAYLEMARAAVALATEMESAGAGEPTVLRDVVWLRPLRLEAPGLEVHVGLVKIASGPVNFEIFTQPEGAGKVVYCQGVASFEAAKAPGELPLTELREKIREQHYQPGECYQLFSQLGIEYGVGHRGLEALYAGGQQLLARVSLPTAIAETQVQYYLHPAVLDSALQGFIGFLLGPDDKTADATPKPSLPFALEKLEIFTPCSASMWAWIRFSEGSAPGDKVAKFDIDLCDDLGRVAVRLRGFSTRVLEESPVAAVEISAPAQLLTLSPVWNVVPAARRSPVQLNPKERLWVIGATDQERQQIRECHSSTVFVSGELDLTRLNSAGPVEHLLWIAPEETLDSLSDERLITGQKDGVYQVFGLIKTLLGLDYGDRDLRWTFITRQTHAVMPGDRAFPLHASVHGLAGSLAKEYPHWKIRLLDLEQGAAWPWPVLLQMPFHSAGDAWFYRHGEWFERGLIPVRDLPSETPLYRPGGVYVVIGGAGGIGEAWTRYMIARYQAKVYWIGRRALDTEIQGRIERIAPAELRPVYLRANAADRSELQAAYAEIKARHGVIHGIVHSAIVLLDKSLAKMDEARFRAGLEAKVDVSVRLSQVFGGEPLDFLLFFSSLQSFSKGPGQSNYAAGCTFKDAFASALTGHRNYAVKVMNWGFWGSLGIVKDAAYHQRMARGGMGSIEPEEGLNALENFMNSVLGQIAVSKVISAAPAGNAPLDPEWMTVFPLSRPALSSAFLELKSPSVAEQFLPRPEELEPVEMEGILLGLLWAGLYAAGVLKGESILRSQVCPAQQAWLEQSLKLLKSKNWLSRPPTEALTLALWDAWNHAKNRWMADEKLAPQFALMETCLRALPEILAGKRKATEVLFPDSSTGLVEGVYRGNPVADYFNEQLADVVVAYVKAQAAQNPAARLRILEVGAGTGGTSAGLLAKLQPFAAGIEEYCYTDISKAFLFHAEKHFTPLYPFIKTRLFDVSQPLEAQGMALDSFDVCVATNVLHATENIRTAIRNVQATLHRGGLLVLNEISGSNLFAHLTFGLLEGWWLYKDAELRIPGCPGLAPETWERVLREEGFGSIVFPARHRHELGQQIVMAQSGGIIRQQRNQPAEVPTPPVEVKSPANIVAKPGEVAGETLRERAVSFLRRLIAAELRMEPGQLDPAKPLEVYGMDSILVVHLTNALRTRFEQITSTLFFEAQTIDALTDHLLKHQREALIQLTGLSVPPPNPAPIEPKPAAAQPMLAAPARELVRSEPAIAPARPGPGDVAIIGLSARFPQARDVDEFWENLKAGKNCVTEIPRERWDWTLHYHPEAGRRGSYYSKWGGFVAEADCFDPQFFQISPREAHRMDPQERLFLETAYACIEDAGYIPATLSATRRVGVFVGVMNSTYHPLPNYASIANRVSYQLDFQGPSLAVDTACSASLTAIHLAVESLNSGTSQCAIAGGVNLNLSPLHLMRLSEARMLSAGQECKPFGNEADGMIDGEGVGAVLLKPLSKALEEGDHIYGVIKSTSVNAGGKTNGYTVPNPVAQARLVADTLDRAGISPRTISYIEAHGTGTVLGDPIEITGLTRAFQEVSKQPTPALQFCAVGSVKSNIGHGESAAGIAGLTKVLLQLKHGHLAPSLHANATNPNIDFAHTPFYVQQKFEEWKRPVLSIDGVKKTCPRRAGISSFGAGGANAHIIVEEFVLEPSSEGIGIPETAAIVLSARNDERLVEVVARLARFLEQHPETRLHELAYTLQVGREAKEQRLGLIVASVEELQTKLQRWLGGDKEIEGLYRGAPSPNRETLSLFGTDEELRDAVAKWLSRGKYGRLLELWANGLAVDWNTHYAGHRPVRISLPTYPFARERYWHAEAALPEAPVSATAETPMIQLPAVKTSTEGKISRVTLAPLAAVSRPAVVATSPNTAKKMSAPGAAQPDDDLEAQLAASLAEALFMAPGSIDPGKAFVELGLDSIVGVEWIQVINKKYGLHLSATKLYEHPTLRQWTSFIRG